MAQARLALKNLSVGYIAARRAHKVIAADLSVNLLAGELVCLLGPNGAGKSTLMRTIAGMQAPLVGQVLLDDADLHRLPARDLARRLSVVMTERVSGGLMTVYELVSLGRYPHTNWSGTLTAKDHEAVRWALETVAAAEFSERNVAELSDGERQKVMVARALAQDTSVMILDEITAFLDLPRRVEITRLLRDLTRTTGRAILLSTHDLDLALRSADRLWLLPKGGELAVGAPEDLVLNGAFEAAFKNEGVDFEAQTGAFRLNRNYEGQVDLTGADVIGFWTARALERAGFQVGRDSSTATIRVETLSVNEQRKWRLTRNGVTQEHDSLYSLVASLKLDS